MKAIYRKVRISPKKANLVAKIVRGEKVDTALNVLKYTPKKAAKIIREVLCSATFNAENNFDQKKDILFIKNIIINKGPAYKRHISISRGRVHPILKRTSHIYIELSAQK